MKMTDLVIGEHYAWQRKRVKLLATGVVLKYRQHKGVQVEVLGHTGTGFIEKIPTRELTSTWEHFLAAQGEWNREEQEKRDQYNVMRRIAGELREAMEQLELYDSRGITLNAYPTYIMLSFNNAEQAELLAGALQSLWGFLEAEKLLESLTDAGLH